MGRRAVALKMDASNYEDVQRGFAAIKKELGPVSIMVNNAALMNHNVTIAKTSIEEWDYEVKLCLNSAFYCIKEAWADMCANNWGRIVNITSVAGVLGGFGQTSYGSAKAGLISMAKSVALEGARFRITANCVLIGISTTDAYGKLLSRPGEGGEEDCHWQSSHPPGNCGCGCFQRVQCIHDGGHREYDGRSGSFCLLGGQIERILN